MLANKIASGEITPSLSSYQKLISRNYTFPVTRFIEEIKKHYNVCFQNAQTLKRSVANPDLILLRHVVNFGDGVVYFVLSDLVAISEDTCLCHQSGCLRHAHESLNELIKEAKKQQSRIWKSQGLCERCGSKPSFWTGNCNNCGHRNT